MTPTRLAVRLTAGLALIGTLGCPSAFLAAPQRAHAAPQARQAAAVRAVTVEEAHRLAESGMALLDVRTPEEFAEGHAPGARLLPLQTLADWAPGLDPATPYVVICRSGNRSGKACAALAARGFGRLHDVQGGMLAWEKDGTLPVVTGKAPGAWPR